MHLGLNLMQNRVFRVWTACFLCAFGCSDADRSRSSTVDPARVDTVPTELVLEEASVQELIDSLCDTDSVVVGAHPTVFTSAFLAIDDAPQFVGGVLGSEAPQANPSMKRLAQLGLEALPELISHLDDRRPTKLKVGGEDIIMSRWFDEEYDPRHRAATDDAEQALLPDVDNMFERQFENEYVVKVGDLCYVLVGQIVNRNLHAVRYQPTSCLVVNSPIESPSLIKRVKRDWGLLTRQEHIDSLRNDLMNAEGEWDGMPALSRLRYYYPEVVEDLHAGALRAKIDEIEHRSSK